MPPMMMKACTAMRVAMPTERIFSKGCSATTARRSAEPTSRRKQMRIAVPPTRPSSSPMAAKIEVGGDHRDPLGVAEPRPVPVSPPWARA
jgi:hypothetical protein